MTVSYTAATANAGADRTVGSQASVVLDGGGSSDPDGDTLDYEWTQSSGPIVTLSGADTATASFTAPLGPATLEFQLRVCDAEPLCDTDTVVVAVAAQVNDPPVASDDEYATDEDTPLSVAAPGVLDNDTDPEGDGLTAAVVSGPEHGSLALNGDGSLGYTPEPDYNGPDSFTYTANDGGLDSDPATVTIEVGAVDDAPVASDDEYATDEDTPLSLEVLGNDTDPDGDRLTATVVSGPEHGSLALNDDGSFGYTPERDYNGPDSFSYTASDGQLDSDPASVAIEVRAVNDAPITAGDSYATGEDEPLNVAAPGLLGNDIDPEGDGLTAALVSGPEHGSLALNGDGSLSYTPERDYNGPDSFTYTASDGALDSDPATVTIEVGAVDDAPVASDDEYATDEDTPLSLEVLGNDTDPDGDRLTATVVSGPEHGSLALNDDGSFGYTPERDYNGPDSFSYTASDGQLDSDPASVAIEVRAVNDAPITAGDSYATGEDEPLNVAAPGLLGNDIDPEGDGLTAALVSGPEHGSLALNGDGSFSYTPEPDYNGPDSFSYTASDGGLDSDPATVAIEVRAVDDTAPAGAAGTPPAGAAPPRGPAAPAEPAIAQLWLGSRCLRGSRSGRVRVAISFRLARPGPVEVRIERGVGTGARDSCPGLNPGRRFTGRFRSVATIPSLPTRAAAAAVTRRISLNPRLAPGLYRITVRARLDHNRLSPPVRRYLRVLGGE